jgi:hypothetical protein
MVGTTALVAVVLNDVVGIVDYVGMSDFVNYGGCCSSSGGYDGLGCSGVE